MKNQFVDEANITVFSGNGGNGCVSMRREKFVSKGGPDGGDGGRGADVVLVADRNRTTLLDFKYRREIKAPGGRNGASRKRTGASGEHVLIPVPIGTIVYDADQAEGSEPLIDFSRDAEEFVVARGGHGGRGNSSFATSTRQAPDFAQPGTAGEKLALRLSLKLLADVGLLGLPNAGKSTLLGRISAARPAVAAYPFTTLVPALGVVERDDRRIVVADIPGLVEGASEGVGLGDQFLRHVERTRVLVHLLDAGAMALEGRDLLADYDTVRLEVEKYQPELAQRAELVAFNKVDLIADRKLLDAAEAELVSRGRRVLRLSGATGEGIEDLINSMGVLLDEARESEARDNPPDDREAEA
jgi:GTP-binding protein